MLQTDLQFHQKRQYRKKIIQVGLVIVKETIAYKGNPTMAKRLVKPLTQIKLKIQKSLWRKCKRRGRIETG